MTHDSYQSPWKDRYASAEMLRLFSDQHKYSLWRRLWIALAEAERELGLAITPEQIDELKAHVGSIDFEAVRRHEKELKHDVMAHIHAYGDQCTIARPIIHLGATSSYVTDNGDLLQYRDALTLILAKLVSCLNVLADFARKHKETPCLGLTHLQPALLTTVGKRACLWLQDLLTDAKEVSRSMSELRLLGAKGAVGTQASFLTLFNGDEAKVLALDEAIAAKLGFQGLYTITGQTYPRKQDVAIAQALAGIATSAHKFATDIRLLTARGECFEPFGERQVGSSAMPFKRNPVLCERVCGLARFALTLAQNSDLTASLQWLERSLDDSSNRRLVMPELFLCIDSICNLLLHILEELQVDNEVIARSVHQHLPFLATEAILMASTRKGGDRQLLHERLRAHTFAAAAEQIRHRTENDLLDRICNDPAIGLSREEIMQCVNLTGFVGCAPQQVERFLDAEVAPFLQQYAGLRAQVAKIEF